MLACRLVAFGVAVAVPTSVVYAQPAAQDQSGPYARPAAKYDVRVEKDVMVPMRDGVRLATDLYMPVGVSEKRPVILVRLPYDKNRYGGALIPARFFASQGYVVAVQDKRGKFGSEGDYIISAADANDGYDAVSWASSQPWSTGKVGTYGCSYLGESQIMLAKTRHPNHVAMIPQAAAGAIGSAGGRYANFGIQEGGALTLSAGFGWFRGAGSKDRKAPPAPQVDFTEALRHLPLIDMQKKYGGPPSDWENVVSKPPADPWWNRIGYITDKDRFDTPALHVNSWYDFGAAETFYLASLMRKNAVSARARDNQFVLISPAAHCASERAGERTIVGERDMGDARLRYWDTYLRWFDYWLKGIDNGITSMPKVQYYLMGKNEWRSAAEWPVPGVRYVQYHLGSGGEANGRGGDGILGPTIVTRAGRDLFTYDPGNPVPSRGGTVCCTGNPKDQPGAFDQSDIEARPDVLVYTSAPLERGLEVVGPVKAVLYVSSDAKDTDITVKLTDVLPDGRSFNVLEAIQRLRYRNGFDRPVWMERGKIYKIEIDLHATAHYFAPGHRIRLDVSSSSFPLYDRNLNTGGRNYDETGWVKAQNVIYHSPRYRSHIVLPLLGSPH
jgi:putative CocE/NonD family hydrolase